MNALLNLSLLFYVLFNALGSIPAFVTLLKEFKPKRQIQIIIREMVFALITIFVFIVLGTKFFRVFNITLRDFQIGGGLLLLLVSLKMIFAKPPVTAVTEQQNETHKEPIFFPLAFPIITGPAILTNLLVYMTNNAHPKFVVVTAIVIAWLASLLTLLSSSFLYRTMGKNGLHALERLFGLVLLMMSTNLILKGFVSIFNISGSVALIGP